jgi:hypothetical protein
MHCFGPERRDKEAKLTRKVGLWLQQQPAIEKYVYLPYEMPSLPDSIRYLLPSKKRRQNPNHIDALKTRLLSNNMLVNSMSRR